MNAINLTSKEQYMKLPKYDRESKKMLAPHVVIIGAGASLAAFPNGDAKGNIIPLMNNLITVVGLERDLIRYGIDPLSVNNFESFYSHLVKDHQNDNLVNDINLKIYEYFSNLQICEEPTIYDYLILSLTNKDIIATFNWDPFLLQAYQRNISVGNLPELSFLHGNVLQGVCEEDKIEGYKDSICNKCGKTLLPSKLLFPVEEKDYTSGPLKSAWVKLSSKLENAYMLTIFGYSAPKSDVAAISIMKKAWNLNKNIKFSSSIVIDIKDKDILQETWKEFLSNENFGVSKSIKDSWLWSFPRTSCEALFDANFQQNPRHENPFKEFKSLEDLQDFVLKIDNFNLAI